MSIQSFIPKKVTKYPSGHGPTGSHDQIPALPAFSIYVKNEIAG